MKLEYEPLNPEAYDRLVCTEIADPNENRHLYSLVIKHIFFGPCSELKKNNICMRNGSCKNHQLSNYHAE